MKTGPKQKHNNHKNWKTGWRYKKDAPYDLKWQEDRSKLFNGGTFYLSCGMTIAQYEKMEKTDKVMFTREVVFSDLELD